MDTSNKLPASSLFAEDDFQICIGVDAETLLVTDELIAKDGAGALLAYVYRAVNEGLVLLGEPRLRIDGQYESPYLVAPFVSGAYPMLLFLHNLPSIRASAVKHGKSAEDFLLESLHAWSLVPQGLALD